MNLFFSFIVGLFVTTVLIPPLIRASGYLQLVDRPNSRKVHRRTVPCVGGIAIALGTLVTVLMWVPLDRTIVSYLVGVLIIVASGIWDDRRSLGYKSKFLAQLMAVLVVIQGGVVFEHVPFFGLDPVSAWVAYPLTILFVLGITNAVNLFDGLDGLAGGCILLSLGAIAVLDQMADGYTITVIALVVMGGVLGFLRYNTHPAIVFMGDSGSQFLGFTSAVLVILLVEKSHSALNPGLPLLLLGLPIVDTLAVMTLRIHQGRSPFMADKQHIHHKLLARGFRDYEAVSLTYLVQSLMVGCAFLLMYSADVVVVGAFASICGTVLGLLYLAKVSGWHMRLEQTEAGPTFVERRSLWLRKHDWLPGFIVRYIEAAVGIFILGAAALAGPPPSSIAPFILGISVLLVFGYVVLKPWAHVLTRIAVYSVTIILFYFMIPVVAVEGMAVWAVDLYLVALAAALVMAIWARRSDLFQVTSQDFLIVIFAVAIPNLPEEILAQYPIATNALRVAVIFYASEYLLSRSQEPYAILRASALAGLVIFGARGMF